MRLGVLPLVLLFAPLLRAQETPDEDRELARNPVADAIEIPLVENFSFDTGPYSRKPNSLQLQPIFPFQISQNFLLVPRVVATPFGYLPDVTQPTGGIVGMGDTIVTLFITPVKPGVLVWGVGPAILIPTATNSNLGGGKWDVGPSFVLLTERKWGSVGAILQNIWSIPGRPRRAAVDQFQIETLFSWNLPHDWYLVTAPTLNADWTQSTGNRWLVPFGGGVGRTFEVRHHGLDSNVTLYYNAIRPAGSPSPKWQLSLQLSLIFPKESKPGPSGSNDH